MNRQEAKNKLEKMADFKTTNYKITAINTEEKFAILMKALGLPLVK